MIGRRSFALGTIAAALMWSTRGIGAPAPGRVYRIGVLGPNPDASAAQWNEFVTEMARRGYSEGRNVVFEKRFGNDLPPGLWDQYARELVAMKVDVLYSAGGTHLALAAKKATKTIPIVFNSSADPVGLGIVASLSRPGGNITGSSISAFDVDPKNLQFLVEAIGKRNIRIAYIQPREGRSWPWFPKIAVAMTAAADQPGAKFEYVDVDSIAEIDLVLKRLVHEGIDAVMLESHSPFVPHLRRLASLLVDHRLPSIGDPRAGFLLEYQVNRLQIARKAAEYVDKILSGASPADLPVEQASTFELVINLKTARALGLQIPQSLLLRASEVIQ
jgi:putative ABC transport system substrate-binding protein